MVTQGKYNLDRYKYLGKVALDRVARDIFTQGKDKVTQGKYNLGRYKYLGKGTHG